MRQTLSDYDDRHEGVGPVGEERADEYSRPDRRLPTILFSVLAMALFAGGLWFAYVQGTRHPAVVTPGTGDGVPLLRADERPTKIKPDQPGGMTVPDQNVSLYSDKPGGVEKLLPAAEQPMPRPAPAANPAAPSPAAPSAASPSIVPVSPGAPMASPSAALSPASPPTAQPPAQATKPAAPKVAQPAPGPPAAAAPQPRQPVSTQAAAPQPKQPAPPAQAAAVPVGKTGSVQVRLASVRSPEAAREEWARMKRENPDLLGKLTAVAVRTDLGEQGIYYRIQAGAFGDAATAEKLCGELKRRKLGCILAR